MKTELLLDVPKDSPSTKQKINAFKALHGIETYRSAHMRREDEPWVALIRIQGHDKSLSIGELMANYAGLYMDSSCSVTAEGELTAIRALCRLNKIPCTI